MGIRIYCQKCGVLMERKSPYHLFCDECKKEVMKGYRKKYRNKKAKENPKKEEEYFTVIKDPDDAWITNSRLNKYNINECLIKAVFTEGTILKNNLGVLYQVVGKTTETPGAKARRGQKLLEIVS